MADRQFTWEAIIDNKGAIRSIHELTDTLKRAFQQSGTKVELIDKASVEAAKASIRSATTEQVESQKRATIEARTQSSERVQLARNESALVAEAAKAASATKIEEERRTTALLRAELQERQRAMTQSAPQNNQSGGNGLQNAVLGGIAGYFTVQGAQQIFNYAKEIAELDTSVSRASKAFEIMSGSANEAEKRLRAIQSASGGTVTEFQAIQIANQATSLGLAKSSGEFEKLTRAARAVTFVSPVIHDVQSAISELALASSNLSFRRLDQLGLSVTEVKTRMSELKAANSGLDDSQAFLAASVDALNNKFGGLLNSTEAQAGGVERLTTAWENFKANIANSNIGELINKEFSDAAFAVDKFSAFLSGNSSKLGTADNLNSLIAGKKNQLTGLSDGGAAYQSQIADLERLKGLLTEVDRLAAAGVPGLDSFAERIRIMASESVAAGHVTEDAAASMGYLQSALAAAEGALGSTTQAGQFYAEAVKIAGAETLETDSKTSALLAGMVNLTIQYNTGAISAAEYGNYINSLGAQLVSMAGQAAIAANEVANLNYQTAVFYAAANNKAFFGSGGTVGTRPIGPLTRPEASSLATDTSINPFTVQAQEKSRNAYHKQLQDEQDKAAKEAMRAAKAGQKAFNTAAKEMNSMITGIVKVSEVTQQDIEDAKNGIYKEKPDEYLRQLRDEVKNKKDYEGVSIEDAAAGLNKIGIETAGKSAEAVLQLFEQAYSNMSLFADASNLKFINDAAVQYQIDLQEKSKQGQENIIRHFGGVVDGAVSAIVGGGGGGGAAVGVAGGVAATGVAPAINIDGQALAGNNLDIKATVTGLEIGADVDTDLSDKFAFKLTINQQSIVLTADDAQLIKDRIAGQITPKFTFNSQSIVFTADDAQIVRERLASQMTPKINLSKEGVISADPKVMETINENLGRLLTPKIWVTDEGGINADPKIIEAIRGNLGRLLTPKIWVTDEGGINADLAKIEIIKANLGKMLTPKIWVTDEGAINADPVKIETIKTNLGDALTPTINPIIEVTQQEQDLARVKIEQSIMPTLRPILGDPTQQEIVAYQQRLDSLVKQKPADTLAGQGGLGNLLVRNGKETGEEKNTLAGDYIASLTDSFNTPENVLALATIGTGIRGAIDSGIRTAPTGDVGTEIIALINGQFFSEANVITIKSIGNNVFELIIAGIRLAMQKKTNNVGQEIVNTIAAQVVTATADAISGE